MNALKQFLKVESPQDKTFVVGFLENLESCQRAEDILDDCQHLTGLWLSQTVAKLLPHLFDLLFVRRKGHTQRICFPRLTVISLSQDQVVEKLFQVELGIVDTLRLVLLGNFTQQGFRPFLHLPYVCHFQWVECLVIISDVLRFLYLAVAKRCDSLIVKLGPLWDPRLTDRTNLLQLA